MKVLHILRNHHDDIARRMMEEIEQIEGFEQTVLLIQDGVYLKPDGITAYACSDDVISRGIQTNLPLINEADIVEMIFEHDKVITW